MPNNRTIDHHDTMTHTAVPTGPHNLQQPPPQTQPQLAPIRMDGQIPPVHEFMHHSSSLLIRTEMSIFKTHLSKLVVFHNTYW